MNRYLFYGLLLLGLGFRVVMLTNYDFVNGGEVDVYLADEGIVGLMGKHILEGRALLELPVFFYGQAYLGALEAYCVALSFALFGVGQLSLRLVPFAFSLLLMAVVYRFTYRRYSVAAARWAVALVAVSPIYFLQWNLKARGGFIEHVVLVFVVMILFWRFYLDHDRSPRTGFLLGLATGVALWVNQLAMPYVIVLAGLLFYDRKDRRGWAPAAAGLALGASLLIGYNVIHPLATPRTLARKVVVLNRVPEEQRADGWVMRGAERRISDLRHGADKLGLVFGVPARAGVEKLGLTERQRQGGPLTPVRRALAFIPAIVFAVALGACRPRRGATGFEPLGSNQLLAVLAVVTFIVGYVSPRYMLPAYPLATVMAGVLVSRLVGTRRRLMVAGLIGVIAYNIVGWVDGARMLGNEDDRRGDELLAALDSRGLDRCYSAAPLYHLVFASEERVIIAPLQKDRYPPYDAVVGASSSICYLYREDQSRKRQHLAFMELLEAEEVAYDTMRSGPYRILFGFVPRESLSPKAIEATRNDRGGSAGVDAGTQRGQSGQAGQAAASRLVRVSG